MTSYAKNQRRWLTIPPPPVGFPSTPPGEEETAQTQTYDLRPAAKNRRVKTGSPSTQASTVSAASGPILGPRAGA
jgi:hypothetical protein